MWFKLCQPLQQHLPCLHTWFSLLWSHWPSFCHLSTSSSEPLPCFLLEILFFCLPFRSQLKFSRDFPCFLSKGICSSLHYCQSHCYLIWSSYYPILSSHHQFGNYLFIIWLSFFIPSAMQALWEIMLCLPYILMISK